MDLAHDSLDPPVGGHVVKGIAGTEWVQLNIGIEAMSPGTKSSTHLASAGALEAIAGTARPRVERFHSECSARNGWHSDSSPNSESPEVRRLELCDRPFGKPARCPQRSIVFGCDIDIL